MMGTKQKRQAKRSAEKQKRESGLPGGGKGRKDVVGRSGVYPASGPLPDNPEAQTHGMASWGQGERGAAGYEDHGESEIANFERWGGKASGEGVGSGGEAGRKK